MGTSRCSKCGSRVLVAGPASLGCPICGSRQYGDEADEGSLWAEHRLGLMFAGGGWRWVEVVEPPDWFMELVV